MSSSYSLYKVMEGCSTAEWVKEQATHDRKRRPSTRKIDQLKRKDWDTKHITQSGFSSPPQL